MNSPHEMTEARHQHGHALGSRNDLVVATRPLLHVHVQRVRRHLSDRRNNISDVTASDGRYVLTSYATHDRLVFLRRLRQVEHRLVFVVGFRWWRARWRRVAWQRWSRRCVICTKRKTRKNDIVHEEHMYKSRKYLCFIGLHVQLLYKFSTACVMHTGSFHGQTCRI